MQSEGVTVVSRRGTNLEIRTGDSLANAQAADPVIRPLGALNGQELRIIGQQAGDVLLVDVDRFVDPDPQGVNYNGTIVFAGQESAGPADRDQLTLIDSDPATDDSVKKISYDYTALETGLITIDPRLDAPEFQVRFSDVERIDQLIDADRLQITTSNLSEQIVVNESAGLIPIQATVGGVAGTLLSIPTPRESFSLNSGGGDDTLQVNDLADVRSEIVIEGGGGIDELILATPLSLGQGDITGNAVLSAETLQIQNSIDTTGGDTDGFVRLISGTEVNFVPGSSIFSGNATITIDGNGGTLDATGGFVRSLSGGDAVVIQDASRVILSGIETPNGTTVIGINGDITGPVSQGPGVTLIADRLTASTGSSLALSNAANEIRLIDGVQSGGPISITDGFGDLTIRGIDSSGHDVEIVAAGIVRLDNNAITARAATVTVSASGIDDLNPGDDLANINAAIVSLTAGADSIGQSGTVIVNASQSVSADITGANGNVRLANPLGDLLIGRIDAGAGRVELMARRIEDASVDSAADIIATRLELQADIGIGTEGAIELLAVQEVNATTARGGINLDWTATTNTIVEQLSADAGDILLRQRGRQVLELQAVRNQSDDITITNEDGTIDIVGVATGLDAIQSDGAGDVVIDARGDDSDVIVRRGIRSDLGNIDLRAGHDIRLQPRGDIVSKSGAVILRADQRSGNHGGAVNMIDGAVIDAGMGTIDIAADGNVTVGSLLTTSQNDSALVASSQSGAIVDGGDQDLDIVVNRGVVTLQSDLGIGFGDRLETAIAILDSQVVGTGGTELLEIDEIILRSVATNDGLIEVTAGGTITAIDVTSSNVNARDDVRAGGDANRRDITLMAQGAGHDIWVENVSALNSADAFLIASDDVLDLDPADDRRVVADDLQVISANDTADQNLAVGLSTAVDDLEVLVMRDHRGDIEIHELDTLRLAASDRGDDTERIETTNGEIRVFAGESIQILDPDATNESFDRTADPEIVAAGANGRIEMRSTDFIEIGNAAQLNAEQSTIEAVVLESDGFVFGEQVEINTGGGVGVARIFSPRPRVPLTNTAFFDFTSVRTTRLEQALVNDAEGTLTLDIGSQGERGLTINIDWGAETRRFQQIDGLSGDAPPLSVEHLYLEQDILESRLNDRTSSTAPLNVKFSVRYHDSILLLGESVVQAGGDVDMVEGGVVSTTDNPLTFESAQVQILENGTAQFIIPNLSIPVAFFPVRDVIPESELPEVFVRQEQTFTVIQTTLETVETSVSTSVSRDEYFQIRALPADPRSGDSAPPARLPDDILDGDKLRTLFSKLPDGRYEIEYVLGDGNERPILTVDLRNGEPKTTSGELDGGTLRLRLLDADQSEQEPEEEGAATEKQDQEEANNDTTLRRAATADVATSHDRGRKLDNAALLAFGAASQRLGRRKMISRNSRKHFSTAKRMISRMSESMRSATDHADGGRSPR